jgi:hypothetical protein
MAAALVKYRITLVCENGKWKWGVSTSTFAHISPDKADTQFQALHLADAWVAANKNRFKNI